MACYWQEHWRAEHVRLSADPATFQLRHNEHFPNTGVTHNIGNGDITFYVDGKTHREDGPAVICKEGDTVCWLLDGMLSRGGNKPAVWRSDGRLDWYWEGKVHRDDGPCYERFVKVADAELYTIHGKRCERAAFELYYMMKYGKVYKVPGPYTELCPG